jgi:proline dehydrogenase
MQSRQIPRAAQEETSHEKIIIDPMAILRSSFIALSTNAPLRHFSERSTAGRRMSSRFVAGMTVEEVVQVAEKLQAQGIASTLDSLGENVQSPEEAERAAAIYHRLLDEIGGKRLNANVSIKLTQVGMDLDPLLAEAIISKLTTHAASVDSFVRVDMEGTPYTQATLDLVKRVHAEPGNQGRVGAVIQAYLFRSQGDIQSLLKDRIRIRLCKGAYQEPPTHAYPEKADVDGNFVRLMHILLKSGVYHGVATHDEAMVNATKKYVEEQKIDPSSFEFQMLYGVRRDLQKKLVAEGFRVRVYVPFGTEWYPYFMRRLAERPANVLFLARNLLRN